MNSVSKAFMALVVVACSLWLVSSEAAAQAADGKVITVKGNISIANSTEDGKVIQVGIWTDDFDFYLLTPEGKGKDLLSMVGKRVKVTGKLMPVKEEEDPIIKVATYELLQEEKAEAEVEIELEPATDTKIEE